MFIPEAIVQVYGIFLGSQGKNRQVYGETLTALLCTRLVEDLMSFKWGKGNGASSMY